jgi:hypothetical protein
VTSQQAQPGPHIPIIVLTAASDAAVAARAISPSRLTWRASSSASRGTAHRTSEGSAWSDEIATPVVGRLEVAQHGGRARAHDARDGGQGAQDGNDTIIYAETGRKLALLWSTSTPDGWPLLLTARRRLLQSREEPRRPARTHPNPIPDIRPFSTSSRVSTTGRSASPEKSVASNPTSSR